MNVTGLLLAGGKSSRMGRNKALLEMAEGLNIQNIASQLKRAAGSVLLITNTPGTYSFLELPIIEDIYPGRGPLAGLHAGLSAATTEAVIVAACDMPFVTAEIMKKMFENLEDADAVVPEIDGRVQPLFAVYRKTCLPHLISCLEDNQLKMTHFLNNIKVARMSEKDFLQGLKNPEFLPYVFYNMNSPEEYEEAREIEQQLKRSGLYGVGKFKI
ncbi:molybdenum cofactor guanylyltransferase [Peribacillus sp. SCS-155]|uniref:molybdenum cofactor guanylyltransferase n=1 Tax=Peribacillus sedimenti TaxID=3115297 RepID=UPI003906BED1